MNTKRYDVIALLSGGLDSILAARLLQEQGKSVKCVHFVTPFFGKPEMLPSWEKTYGLDIQAEDVGQDFVDMLIRRPEHGFGKVMNPCIDCKILLLRKARALMHSCGARVIVTGEVIGQRPMSQRRDALNIISREAGVRDILLRPLCAQVLEPTQAEESGFVDRSRLEAFSGRSRRGQLELAARYGITKIPTPAGGCRLTEVENARSYWPVLQFMPAPCADDFVLAKTGRQFWKLEDVPKWLNIGRTQADNERLLALASGQDILFKVEHFPGPIGLGRAHETCLWNDDLRQAAAAFTASFSPKAVAADGQIEVRVWEAGKGFESGVLYSLAPQREQAGFAEFPWERAKEEIRTEAREKARALTRTGGDA